MVLDGGKRAKMLIFRIDTQFPFVNNGKCTYYLGQSSIALSANILPAEPVCGGVRDSKGGYMYILLYRYNH